MRTRARLLRAAWLVLLAARPRRLTVRAGTGSTALISRPCELETWSRPCLFIVRAGAWSAPREIRSCNLHWKAHEARKRVVYEPRALSSVHAN